MPAMPEPATTTSVVMSHLDGMRRRPGVGAAKTGAAKPSKPDAAAPAKNERRETSMMISSRGDSPRVGGNS